MHRTRRERLTRRTRTTRLAVAALTTLTALASLSGCSANRRPHTTVAALAAEAPAVNAQERALRDTVIARLVRRAVRRGDGTLDVLMLSGGGQNGAFGVGFLRAWRDRTDAPMPTFDLVTGISTGSLQAPYALIGTREALDTIVALYRRSAETIAPSIDWISPVRRTGGLVNTAKFDRTLERTIDGRFRDALKGAFADDRQIVFGTSDFDLGIGRAWSLADEMGATDAGLARARTLLRAATAIPGIFPPVVVDGHVHADGGVIANVLPLLRYEDYERLAAALRSAGVPRATIRVWTVMNLWSHANPAVSKASSRRNINGRSTALLFYTHQPETLTALADLARAVSATIPGLTMEYRVTLLPQSTSTEPGAEKLFDKAFLRRLEEVGAEKARSATPWDVVPSAYLRPVTKGVK